MENTTMPEIFNLSKAKIQVIGPSQAQGGVNYGYVYDSPVVGSNKILFPAVTYDNPNVVATIARQRQGRGTGSAWVTSTITPGQRWGWCESWRVQAARTDNERRFK